MSALHSCSQVALRRAQTLHFSLKISWLFIGVLLFCRTALYLSFLNVTLVMSLVSFARHGAELGDALNTQLPPLVTATATLAVTWAQEQKHLKSVV